MKILPKLSSVLCIVSSIVILGACSQNNNDNASVTVKDSLKLPAGNEYATTDQSPMDISYFPKEFPQNKMSGTLLLQTPVARVIYSRPHKKGRPIFGTDEKNLCPYGKPWRLGANESTEIEFFVPVVINGNNVKAGRYILYCVPYADKWIVVLNSNIDSWGLQIDPSKDILQTEIPVQKHIPALEDFTIVFEAASYGADLIMAWDEVKVSLPVTFSN